MKIAWRFSCGRQVAAPTGARGIFPTEIMKIVYRFSCGRQIAAPTGGRKKCGGGIGLRAADCRPYMKGNRRGAFGPPPRWEFS